MMYCSIEIMKWPKLGHRRILGNNKQLFCPGMGLHIADHSRLTHCD